MYISPNVVVGFHGCDSAVFDAVIKRGEPLGKSENDYDWLGHGMYFWEGSYDRAMDWAKNSKTIQQPAVIGAFIKLGNCLDLLDILHVQQVKTAHQILMTELEKIGCPIPSNRITDAHGISFVRDLDCKVLMRLQEINDENIAKQLKLKNPTSKKSKYAIQHHPDFIDSVRGMFPEGKELYEGAGFREKNHIQLCIINPNCILGYFNPQQPDPAYKTL